MMLYDYSQYQYIQFWQFILIIISMLFSRRILTLPKYLRSYKQQPKFCIRPTSLPLKFNFCAAKVEGEKMQFKAETKKLLDIVAKSLYTDSEVFLRQLLSNASDALEKQRFTTQTNDDLHVNIETNLTKKQIIIEDNGIGMSKQDLIANLGTIARSGSKQFLSKIEEDEGQKNIIGQFGVGFYSSFIIADFVEVISRCEGSDKAYKWSSDGSGQFFISEVEDDSFNRGSKIILHMRPEHQNFLENTQIQKIAQKYSNFINYPITLNGQALNLVKALWSRDKNQISEEEYQNFYEYLANKSEKYQYKLHLKADVPLSIKSILYIPKSHSQKFGMGQQKGEVSLYSKKVLIKKDCKEILIPNFLRFVKGVVDCEDIPLNISRESYQDSALMGKIRGFVTKRILKELKQEAEYDPETYTKWYEEFNVFIKEGSLDPEFKKDVALLNRYECNLAQKYISFKDYLQKKKPTQDRIFYLFSPSKAVALDSPYVYPLTKAGVPVIIANTHVDEVIFREIDTFEGLKFSNVQTDTDDVERVLKSLGETNQESTSQEGVSSEQLTPFSLWIKNELQPFVDKVNVSKKTMKGPALVISPISSSMRQMAFMKQMMQQKMKTGVPRNDLRNITFEFNPKDPLIMKLNEYRKKDGEGASLVVRQIFDNCCMQAGLESDGRTMISRINNILDKLITQK